MLSRRSRLLGTSMAFLLAGSAVAAGPDTLGTPAPVPGGPAPVSAAAPGVSLAVEAPDSVPAVATPQVAVLPAELPVLPVPSGPSSLENAPEVTPALVETSAAPSLSSPAPAPDASVTPVPATPVTTTPTVSAAEEVVLTGEIVHSILEGKGAHAHGEEHDDEHAGEHAGEHDEEHPDSVQVSFLDTGSELVQVRASEVAGLVSGTPVTLNASEYVLSDPDASLQEMSLAGYQQVAVNVTGSVSEASPVSAVHEVTVVSVVPPGVAPSSTSAGTLVNLVNGPVNDYWSGQTEGEHTFQVVKALDRVAVSVGCEDAGKMWSEAASKSGFVAGANKHLLVFVPDTAPHCAYGLATVGPNPNSGGRSYITAPALTLAAHELGHNLGLWHASAYVCSTGSDGPVGTCQHKEYHDAFDVMGASGSYTGNLSGAQLSRLNARRSARLDVTSSVTTDLHPLGGASGVRVVKMKVPQGGEYYIEYRSNVGRDTEMERDFRRPGYGVQVRRVQKDGSTVLLDPRWLGGEDHQQALGSGESMLVENGRLLVKVNSITSGVANVSLTLDQAPPRALQPDVLTLTSPTSGQALGAGRVRVLGTSTASEGTLLWEMKNVLTGEVAGTGYTATGFNGHVAAFDFFLVVPAGTWDLKLWVPSESDTSEAGVLPQNIKTVRFRTL